MHALSNLLFQTRLVILAENRYNLFLTQSSYAYDIVSEAQFQTDTLCVSQCSIYSETIHQD